jgi:serralysin
MLVGEPVRTGDASSPRRPRRRSMPTTVVNVDLDTTQTINTDNSVYIVNASISTGAGDALAVLAAVDDAHIIVNGVLTNTLSNHSSDAIDSAATAALAVTVSAGALVQGGSGIRTAGVLNLVNQGTIGKTNITGHAIVSTAASGLHTVVNHGLIHGTISMTAGADAAIDNFGTIKTDGLFIAIHLGNGNDTVTNTGSIVGTVGASVLQFGEGENALYNTGSILGNISFSIGDDTFENFGVIRGTVSLGGGTNTARNGGQIVGSVQMSGTSTLSNSGVIGPNPTGAPEVLGGVGIETIFNSGIIVGSVQLGDGNDVYDGAGGQVTGVVFGEGDADTLRGGSFTDLLDGGGGDDILEGRGGADLLKGNTGVDAATYEGALKGVTASLANSASNTGDAAGDSYDEIENLTGSAFADRLIGDTGANTLDGRGGNDTLDGGAGFDILIGDFGNDIFIGGAGLDTQTGGVGNDLFRVANRTHSPNSALRDVITDFDANGNDRIDFSALFGPKMTYRHTAAFNGLGQVRILDVAGPDVIVLANVVGSLAPDVSIRLLNTTAASMSAGDFIL